jgi:hypothetical protein
MKQERQDAVKKIQISGLGEALITRSWEICKDKYLDTNLKGGRL